MTQGKIERWHQTLKNRILLEHYYLPGDLQAEIETFVEHYNNRRYHESLGNLTQPTSTPDAVKPSASNANASNGRPFCSAACSTTSKPRKFNPGAPDHPLIQAAICLKKPDNGQERLEARDALGEQ